jgi:hypothetical protein
VGDTFAVNRHGRRSYGDFLADEQGNVKLLDRGLLIRWDEVEYLVFQEP